MPKSPSIETLRQRVITAAKRWASEARIPHRNNTSVLAEAVEDLERAERKHRADQCRHRRFADKVLARVRLPVKP